MILGTNKIAPISISFKNKIQNEQEEFNGMVHDNSIASPTHVTAYVLPIWYGFCRGFDITKK